LKLNNNIIIIFRPWVDMIPLGFKNTYIIIIIIIFKNTPGSKETRG